MKSKAVISMMLVGILTLSGISVPTKTYASNLAINTTTTQSKELPVMTVNKNKKFTITFNKDIDYKTINKNNIKVTNFLGYEVNVSVDRLIGSDNVALVKPPTEGYIEGAVYTLTVKKDIKDTNNLSLLEEVKMKFIIKRTTIQASVFTRSDIKTISNYSDITVSEKDIILKDFNDLGTNIKPSYTIPTAYNSKLKTDFYDIANTIINPQMYTTLSYGDEKKRLMYYDRVKISYARTKVMGLTDFAFSYGLYTNETPYLDYSNLSYSDGYKPLGTVYMGTQFLDNASINSFNKINKILFGEQGDDISNEIVKNYKLYSNDIDGFGGQKDFGNIRIEANYTKELTIIQLYIRE
ncbi:Ig-like domain-containing protein [Clostridium sp.]|uniref:Ig-like domain-containing protein n=1 Tax=Clostridium sp. TaxID=1506 RepID=UPI001A4F1531|nr:Ig-like domain-containing protein [Clostridium sp.]MBK5235278.1 Ig-like domain-containing protein [Clostridium sp.]